MKFLREGYLSRWLALAILGWMVLNLLVHFPDNHGDGFSGLWRIGFLNLLIWIAESFFTKKLNYDSMFLLLMCLLLGLASDKYNLFISYEDWIERGMPRWGHSVYIPKPAEPSVSAKARREVGLHYSDLPGRVWG